jgi:cyclopropane fatty-acyl-phospholipid synthase-like methyltransferase
VKSSVTGRGIKSMKLYRNVQRIHNELKAAGIDGSTPLAVSDLSPFDQYHYHGTDAVDTAIERLGIDSGFQVADVGAGIGGPARYIAERTGCTVYALELQEEMNELASELTARCGLSGQVRHIAGDVLDIPLEPGRFDAVVSWLAVYHIADQRRFWSKCRRALKPGGAVFIEDLCVRRPLSPTEQGLMSAELYAQSMVTFDAYRERLRAAGFVKIDIEDMSDSWARFTRQRLLAFGKDRDRHLEVQGEETVAALGAFYQVVEGLFRGGNLGGLRLTARAA